MTNPKNRAAALFSRTAKQAEVTLALALTPPAAPGRAGSHGGAAGAHTGRSGDHEQKIHTSALIRSLPTRGAEVVSPPYGHNILGKFCYWQRLQEQSETAPLGVGRPKGVQARSAELQGSPHPRPPSTASRTPLAATSTSHPGASRVWRGRGRGTGAAPPGTFDVSVDLALRVQVVQALQDLPQDGGDVRLLQGPGFQLQAEKGRQGLRHPHWHTPIPAPRPRPPPGDKWTSDAESGGRGGGSLQTASTVLSAGTKGVPATAEPTYLGALARLHPTSPEPPGNQWKWTPVHFWAEKALSTHHTETAKDRRPTGAGGPQAVGPGLLPQAPQPPPVSTPAHDKPPTAAAYASPGPTRSLRPDTP